MSDKVYRYLAEQVLSDGTSLLLDLEEHGWADKGRLTRTVAFNLVPKDGATSELGLPLPVVLNPIPAGARPVFHADAYGTFEAGLDGQEDGPLVPLFRVYGVGWKRGSEQHLVWVLPTGSVQFDGETTEMCHLIINAMKQSES